MDWPLILEYFKVLLSVQMVTAIILIIFLSTYHVEVKGILNRIIKLLAVLSFQRHNWKK